MRLYCDNNVVINIAHNLAQHDRANHIKKLIGTINELFSEMIFTPYLKTRKQLAGILTIGVSSNVFPRPCHPAPVCPAGKIPSEGWRRGGGGDGPSRGLLTC